MRAHGIKAGWTPASLTRHTQAVLQGAFTLAKATGGRQGSELTVEFTLLGRKFVGLNGGPNFTPDEAISFMVATADQEETDR
jgi:predicted 3-demethylubiquinone-9 3-methyltransferase (glyoxalase superfamily)